jgi:hypothetical protein
VSEEDEKKKKKKMLLIADRNQVYITKYCMFTDIHMLGNILMHKATTMRRAVNQFVIVVLA